MTPSTSPPMTIRTCATHSREGGPSRDSTSPPSGGYEDTFQEEERLSALRHVLVAIDIDASVGARVSVEEILSGNRRDTSVGSADRGGGAIEVIIA